MFTSWGLEGVQAISKEKLTSILDRLKEGTEFGTVIRAKGMVPTEDRAVWLYFDLVPGETEIREGGPDYTGKVCVIGSDLKEEALEKEFRS